MNYDPNAMFPKKVKKTKHLTTEQVAKFILIAGLVLFTVFIAWY